MASVYRSDLVAFRDSSTYKKNKIIKTSEVRRRHKYKSCRCYKRTRTPIGCRCIKFKISKRFFYRFATRLEMPRYHNNI